MLSRRSFCRLMSFTPLLTFLRSTDAAVPEALPTAKGWSAEMIEYLYDLDMSIRTGYDGASQRYITTIRQSTTNLYCSYLTKRPVNNELEEYIRPAVHAILHKWLKEDMAHLLKYDGSVALEDTYKWQRLLKLFSDREIHVRKEAGLWVAVPYGRGQPIHFTIDHPSLSRRAYDQFEKATRCFA